MKRNKRYTDEEIDLKLKRYENENAEAVKALRHKDFVHRRSQPQHNCSAIPSQNLGMATNLFRVWNVRTENERMKNKLKENHNEH